MNFSEIEKLKKLGLTNKQIAESLKTSYSSVRKCIALHAAESKIDLKQFTKLYDEGLEDNEIAKKLNCSKSSVTAFRYKLKLKAQDTKRRKNHHIQFQKLYDLGLNDSEIARRVGVNNVTVHYWRKNLGLTPNFKYSRKFDTKAFNELFEQGLNYSQMSKILNCSEKALSDYGRSLNLKPNVFNKTLPNNTEKQIILGTLLGDGWLYNKGAHSNGGFAHSEKQAEYCKWKAAQLKRFVTSVSYKEEQDKRTGKTYKSYTATFKSSEYLSSIYPHLYDQNRKKHIYPEIVAQLNALGLAVWFMDDGYKSSCGYYIATNCFDIQELKNIIEILERNFGLKPTINKSDNNLYFGAKQRDLFTKIVMPYIHNDCRYKLIESSLAPINSAKQGNSEISDNPVLNPTVMQE